MNISFRAGTWKRTRFRSGMCSGMCSGIRCGISPQRNSAAECDPASHWQVRQFRSGMCSGKFRCGMCSGTCANSAAECAAECAAEFFNSARNGCRGARIPQRNSGRNFDNSARNPLRNWRRGASENSAAEWIISGRGIPQRTGPIPAGGFRPELKIPPPFKSHLRAQRRGVVNFCDSKCFYPIGAK